MPFLTTAVVHYFREAVQSTIAAPTQPTALQHPGAVGNAAAVAVKGKGDIWYVPDPTTENNHPEQLTRSLSLFLVCFLPLPLIVFTVSASEML